MSEVGKTIALIEALKGSGGGSSLPSVTSSDNGKVLAVENGAWAASEQGKKFIVTLTPTALDYSGTMDKTVAEINAAYEAGMEIVFRIYVTLTMYYDLPCSNVAANEANNYLIMGAFGIMNDLLILLKTHDKDGDGTGQTYKTTIYSLTPAS